VAEGGGTHRVELTPLGELRVWTAPEVSSRRTALVTRSGPPYLSFPVLR
jgi:hypothetical protein